MKTRKLALLSTMLVGLGGAAMAQQATEAPNDQLLPEGSEAATQAEGQAQDQTEGMQASGTGDDDDRSEAARQALGETDAGDGMAEDGAGAMAEGDTATTTGTGMAQDEDPAATGTGMAQDEDPAATGTGMAQDDAGSLDADGAMTNRARSFTQDGQVFEGTIFANLTADELIGRDVVDAHGESLGSVSDLLINESGEIDRVVLDVGGFLGFGSKNVAIGLDQLHYDSVDDVVQADLTSDQLDQMPEWQRDDEGWFAG